MIAKYQQTKVLTTQMLLEAGACTLDPDWGKDHLWRPVWEDGLSLQSACDLFQEEIWHPWLQKYYQEAAVCGHIANLEGHSMLVWGSAGRVMITFQKEDTEWPYLSFLAAEYDEGYDIRPKMGVQGVGGTVLQALDLVKPFLDNPNKIRQLIHPENTIGLG